MDNLEIGGAHPRFVSFSGSTAFEFLVFGVKIPNICSPGDGAATKHCCQIPRQQVPGLHVVWVLLLKQLILLYSFLPIKAKFSQGLL